MSCRGQSGRLQDALLSNQHWEHLTLHGRVSSYQVGTDIAVHLIEIRDRRQVEAALQRQDHAARVVTEVKEG